MFATVSAWCLALAIGQAPQGEANRLNAIPSDVQIVARLRGLQPARDDLVKMLEAMSPNLAAMAGPTIDRGVKSARDRFGKTLASAPLLIAVRLPAPVPQGVPPKIAVLVDTDDYAGLIKAIAGDDKPEKKAGGVDSFKDPNGAPMFAAKGPGFAAVGTDEKFLAEIVRPKNDVLSQVITGEARERLFEGELGIYLNLAAIQKQFGDQIDQARDAMMKQIEQQGKGNPAGDLGKSFGEAVFKAFKSADGLVFNFDFAPAGLIIRGDATLKKDTEAFKKLATSKTGDAAGLSKLPANLSNFTFIRVSPGGSDAMLRAGVTLMLSTAEKDTESFRKATALMKEAGAREGYVATVVNVEKPMSLGITVFDDPRKGVEAMLADLKTVREGKGLVKDVETVSTIKTYRGFELHEVHVTLDLDKFAKMTENNPAAAAIPKPPEKTTSWFGTDGKVVLNVGAPTWEEARARIDSYLDGKGTIGEEKGFQAARKLLPSQVGAIFLFGAQAFVGDFIKGMALGMGKELKIPKLPGSPVFFGVSLSPTSTGYHFRLVVPNDVGPIIEQGVLPILQQGKVQQ